MTAIQSSAQAVIPSRHWTADHLQLADSLLLTYTLQVKKEEASKPAAVAQQQAANAAPSTSYKGTIRYQYAQSASHLSL